MRLRSVVGRELDEVFILVAGGELAQHIHILWRDHEAQDCRIRPASAALGRHGPRTIGRSLVRCCEREVRRGLIRPPEVAVWLRDAASAGGPAVLTKAQADVLIKSELPAILTETVRRLVHEQIMYHTGRLD